MKVYYYIGLVRSNLLHATCVTCNILSEFSYTYAFMQLFEKRQVDSAETKFPYRMKRQPLTLISAHGNKPYFYINLQIGIMFNIPPIPWIRNTELINRDSGNIYIVNIFHFSRHYLPMSKKIDFEYLRCHGEIFFARFLNSSF